MTLYTDDDVQRGCEALDSGYIYEPPLEPDVRRVLDAVLPAYLNRLADEYEAIRDRHLREYGLHNYGAAGEWLRRKAEETRGEA